MSGSALLVMDFQQLVVARHGGGACVARVADALAAARSHSVPTLYVGIWFRSGHPEISQRNKLFSKIAAGGDFVGEAAGQYPAEIAPAPGDPFILKKRTSAFAGSDLQILLGSMEIDTLVLAGIATSGVVLSTVRAAADLDYRLIVLSDACADADSEVHRVLLEKVFPKQAEVMTVSEWETGLPPAGERELSH